MTDMRVENCTVLDIIYSTYSRVPTCSIHCCKNNYVHKYNYLIWTGILSNCTKRIYTS